MEFSLTWANEYLRGDWDLEYIKQLGFEYDIPESGFWKNRVHILNPIIKIEINSIEDLLELMGKTACGLIIEKDCGYDDRCIIEIYNDYRE